MQALSCIALPPEGGRAGQTLGLLPREALNWEAMAEKEGSAHSVVLCLTNEERTWLTSRTLSKQRHTFREEEMRTPTCYLKKQPIFPFSFCLYQRWK